MNNFLTNLFGLKDKISIVTGGSTGIGRAIAEGLAEAGSMVVIANRKREEGEKAAKEIINKGCKAIYHQLDVTQKESVEILFNYIKEEFGHLDVLINDAGINRLKKILDYTEEDLQTIMQVNVLGTFLCSRAAFPLMKEKGGKIINLSSLTVFKCLNNGSSVYSVAKSGVSQFTKVCAVEWAPYKITVNAIAPGLCITNLNKTFYEKNPEILKKICATIPLASPAKPDDFTGIAIFLASPASNYITGQTFVIDGGLSLT